MGSKTSRHSNEDHEPRGIVGLTKILSTKFGEEKMSTLLKIYELTKISRMSRSESEMCSPELGLLKVLSEIIRCSIDDPDKERELEISCCCLWELSAVDFQCKAYISDGTLKVLELMVQILSKGQVNRTYEAATAVLNNCIGNPGDRRMKIYPIKSNIF